MAAAPAPTTMFPQLELLILLAGLFQSRQADRRSRDFQSRFIQRHQNAIGNRGYIHYVGKTLRLRKICWRVGKNVINLRQLFDF
jgi:hypothetical protein